MKLIINRIFVVFLVFCSLAITALADDNSSADNSLSNYSGGWANIGLGAAGGSNFSGAGIDLSLNYAPSAARLWTLRTSQAIDFSDMFSGIFCTGTCSNNEKSAGDFALMYGLMKKNSEGYVSASSGLALAAIQEPQVTVNGVVTQDGTTQYTVGLPLEVQAFLTPFRYMGVGLIGFGDINAKRSFGGVALALQFGKLY